MRNRKIVTIMICVLLICITLSACGSNNVESAAQFAGGEYFCDLLSYSNGTPVETYTFNSDGTGVINGKSYSSDFTWKDIDGMIRTTVPVMNSTSYEYTGKYLVDPINKWDGKIPSGKSFSASLTLKSTYNLELNFKKDGTVTYTIGDESRSGTYTVDGDILTVTYESSHIQYAIIDSALYSNFLQPIA